MLRLLSQPLELGKAGLLSGAAVCWVRLPALHLYHMFHRALWRNAGLAAKAGLCLGFLPWIVLIVGLTGVSAWIYEGDGTWRNNFGKQVTATGLEEHLRALSKKSPYIIRPLVFNHRDLGNLIAGALSTVRVITCLDEDGCPEVANALFKMAIRPDAVVDNYHAGGVVSKVDVTTGRLNEAILGTGSYRTHPTTGAPIAGRGRCGTKCSILPVAPTRPSPTTWRLAGTSRSSMTGRN